MQTTNKSHFIFTLYNWNSRFTPPILLAFKPFLRVLSPRRWKYNIYCFAKIAAKARASYIPRSILIWLFGWRNGHCPMRNAPTDKGFSCETPRTFGLGGKRVPKISVLGYQDQQLWTWSEQVQQLLHEYWHCTTKARSGACSRTCLAQWAPRHEETMDEHESLHARNSSQVRTGAAL